MPGRNITLLATAFLYLLLTGCVQFPRGYGNSDVIIIMLSASGVVVAWSWRGQKGAGGMGHADKQMGPHPHWLGPKHQTRKAPEDFNRKKLDLTAAGGTQRKNAGIQR
jgi:hypothetical protein